MGGHAAPERMLEIMKDPQVGAMEAVALLLALLAKFALFSALWPHHLEALLAGLMLGLAVIASVLVLWWWRRYWMQRIGDIAGALIEISEIIVLLVFVLVAAHA